MVTITEIYAAVGDQRMLGTLFHPLVRAYYRTGQLDVRDWPYVLCVQQGLNLRRNWWDLAINPPSPEWVQAFYERILPTLSPEELMRVYLYRFTTQVSEALDRILETDVSTAVMHLGRRRELNDAISRDAIQEGAPPGYIWAEYYQRVPQPSGEIRIQEVGQQYAQLPEETILYVMADEDGKATYTLTPEEVALTGAELGSTSTFYSRHPRVHHRPQEMHQLYLRPIDPKQVESVWRQTIRDTNYLPAAFIMSRAPQREDIKTMVTQVLLGIRDLQVGPPILRAYLQYMRHLCWCYLMTGLPVLQGFNDPNPLFEVIPVSVPEWQLDLDTHTQQGLSSLMGGYAGRLPNDNEIMTRLARL